MFIKNRFTFIFFLSGIFALNTATSHDATPIEDDLTKLKKIFERNSMYIVNESIKTKTDQPQVCFYIKILTAIFL